VNARRAHAATGSGRHRAREALFRVAYQAEAAGDDYQQAWDAFAERERLSEAQQRMVGAIVRVLDRDRERIDATLAAAAAHWPLQRMSATDRSVLRAAAAELLASPETPARVVLDEAIEIAKRYGSEESGRFVNGVLDHVARALRAAEF
jgi:N utilization substance protein B